MNVSDFTKITCIRYIIVIVNRSKRFLKHQRKCGLDLLPVYAYLNLLHGNNYMSDNTCCVFIRNVHIVHKSPVHKPFIIKDLVLDYSYFNRTHRKCMYALQRQRPA